MKTKGIVFIALTIITVLLAVVLLNKRQQLMDRRHFNKHTFPKSVVVTNMTSMPKVDTIALVLSHLIFKFDTIEVKVYNMPRNFNRGEVEYYGIVQQLPFGRHKYIIFLNPEMGLSKIKLTMCHEFVHIHQYERGDLELNVNSYIWKGDTIVPSMKYDERPFEVEAFNKQKSIYKQLENLLYE